MLRRGLFEPIPPELQGATISIRYISTLAEAQRASSTAVIERVAQFAGSISAVQPQIMDNLDTDKMLDIYADRLGLPPDIMRDEATVQAIRAQRQQAQQAAAALQTGQAAAQGAATLSKADVGGGQNALSLLFGGGPQSFGPGGASHG
jgi:hypothetical protein